MLDASTWIAIAVFSLPHWFYAYVWVRPDLFIAGTKKWAAAHAVTVFASLATMFKVLQLIVILWWAVLHPPVAKEFPSPLSFRFVVCVLAVILGQILNAAIYWAIGHDGVYYGIRLGRPVPWYTGFPFHLFGVKIPHPQYLGSSMTICGLAGLFYTSTTTYLPVIAAFSTVFYVITAIIEENQFTK
ncbi:phosphatidyl-N-methylethanolamine N-methyltransferase [Plasmodiophora brassicae]